MLAKRIVGGYRRTGCSECPGVSVYRLKDRWKIYEARDVGVLFRCVV
jgi:hypothetical protein